MAIKDWRDGIVERRRHQRVGTERRVSFLHGGLWQNCRIVDVSRGGAAIASPLRPRIDKEIILHIDEIGTFKCRVLRHREDGFALRFEAADFDLEPRPSQSRRPRLELVKG